MSTSISCQKLCANTANCVQFSYNTISKYCFIYSASSKIPRPGSVGGPRECPTEVLDLSSCSKTVCLVGGSSQREGNVYVDGSPVCDDYWGETEAELACKELNFTAAQRFTTESKFGLVST